MNRTAVKARAALMTLGHCRKELTVIGFDVRETNINKKQMNPPFRHLMPRFLKVEVF